MIPHKTQVLIQTDPPKGTTDAGIVIAKPDPSRTGKVIRIGDDVEEIAVGDKVTFLRNHIVDNEDGTILIDVSCILFVEN